MKEPIDYIPETCPMINSVISIIQESFASGTPIDKWDKNEAERLLEDIWQINYKLRTCAMDYLEERNSLQDEFDNLKNESDNYIDDLRNQIESLKDEIVFLGNQIRS
jgi:DNA repair ATPase RecN